MNKFGIKKIFIATSAFFLFSIVYHLSSISVLAQTSQSGPLEYTVLAPLPGTTIGGCEGADCKADLRSYIPGLFNLVIGLSAVIAVAYIIWGGFLYITTDAIVGKSEGREKIKNAIYGLVMVSAAWIILYTINPRLLTFELGIGATPVPSQFGPPGTLTTVSKSESATRSFLELNKIDVNANSCTTGQTRGCTNVAGMPIYTLQGLSTLKSECTKSEGNCALTITGGTEGGHVSHGEGRGQVDLRPSTSLNSYLGTTKPTEGTQVDRTINGRNVRFTYEIKDSNSSGDHWHASFEQH